jgi:hypothetical protein
MVNPELAQNQADDGDAPTQPPPKREPSQATLSAVGDITMAATDSIGRLADAPRATRWVPVLGFFLLVYVATCLVTLSAFQRDPWVRAFVAPSFPVLLATAAFWWRQRWKFRAKRASLKLKFLQNALGSLSHEATSGSNAIRANLAGFRLANPQTSQPELLSAIELATVRIDKALQKSNGLLNFPTTER